MSAVAKQFAGQLFRAIQHESGLTAHIGFAPSGIAMPSEIRGCCGLFVSEPWRTCVRRLSS